MLNQSSSITEIIETILRRAISNNASDIHFEPYTQAYRVRLRIDGMLYETYKLEPTLAPQISSCFKIMAKLDIAEKRLPQDGKFIFKIQHNQTYDCRLSICPTLHGEKLVIRILNSHNLTLQLDQLGLEPWQQQILVDHIHAPQGMILVTGPTGSGKTITLYSILNTIYSIAKNISTVEDPVEIYLDGFNQVEVNQKIGLTFPSVLRTFLRQDPDIIVLGEIRDPETAQTAFKAAQTGHLVLATLHTNTAVESLTRLLHMGITTYSLANSISLIIAQRLARKLCPSCKKSQANTFIAQSCRHCVQGYKGRTGIFELLPVNSALKQLITTHCSNTSTIENHAQKIGMQTLKQIAHHKVNAGITSIAEIQRIIL